MLLRRPGKEPLSGGHITPFTQKKVDGSTLLIDGAIEVDPSAFNFDVGFTYTPGVADWPCVRLSTLFKIRHIALHPPQDRRMSQQDAALGHHLDQVTGTELESEVPSHTQDDDFLIKMPPLEEIVPKSVPSSRRLSRDTDPFNTLHQNLPNHLCLGMRTDMLLHLHANSLQIEPHFLQHIDCYAFSKFDQAEQQVFSSHVIVAEPLGLSAWRKITHHCVSDAGPAA
jgi:hypothetical protein